MLAAHAPQFSRSVLAGSSLKKITLLELEKADLTDNEVIIEKLKATRDKNYCRCLNRSMTGKIKGCHKVSMTLKTIGFSGILLLWNTVLVIG